eukprot:g20374.t1
MASAKAKAKSAKAKPKPKPKPKAAPASTSSNAKKNESSSAASNKRARNSPAPAAASNNKRKKKFPDPNHLELSQEIQFGEQEDGDGASGVFVAEEELPNGDRRAKDLSYDPKAKVKPQSAALKKKTIGKKGDGGEAAHALGQPDADLDDEARAQLNETGFWEDLICLPWAVVKRGCRTGTEMKKHGSGFASYLVTFAAPDAKKRPDLLQPSQVDLKKFLDTIWAVHKEHDAHLKKAVARRERSGEDGTHEHLHAAITAGSTQYRYRYGAVAKELYELYRLALNFSHVPFNSAVGYLSRGSSRKYQFNFIDEPLLRFHRDEEVQTIEEMVLGHNNCNTEEQEAYEFHEFRALIEQKKIEDLQGLHRLTVGDKRLDAYVNGNGTRPDLPGQLLRSALNSLACRNMPQEVIFITELLEADARKTACMCGGKQTPAVKAWSRGLRWSDRTLSGELVAGGMILHWAINGRIGGALCFTGTGGTGKTWILHMVRATLRGGNGRSFDMASNDGSYSFEQLGAAMPETLCFLLDEMNLQRLGALFTNGRPGYWKHWLSFQTADVMKLQLAKNRHHDREEFDQPAPVMYSGTWPLRMELGADAGFDSEEKAQAENAQQRRREVQALCPNKVDPGPGKRIPPCGKCFSQYLNECNNHYKIWCRDTGTRLSDGLPKEPPPKDEFER